MYPYDWCFDQRWYQGMGTENTNLQRWLKRPKSEQTGSSYSTMNNPPPICGCLWHKQNTNLGGGMRGWQKIRLEQKCNLRGGKNVGKEAQRLVLWSTSGSRCGLQVFAWTAVTATNEKSGTIERQIKGPMRRQPSYQKGYAKSVS